MSKSSDNILNLDLPSVNSFFKHFDPHFSSRMSGMLRTAVLSLFLEHNRSTISQLASKSKCGYENLQYFISDSKWDSIGNLNRARLEKIFSHKTTRPTQKGVAVIDDTGNPKPFAKRTEGVSFQYCGSAKREERCHNIVFSAYADAGKHFPIEFETYKPAGMFEDGVDNPSFCSKISIARDFITRIAEDPALPKTVVADSWYGAAELVEHSDKLGVTFISEPKPNRNIWFHRPDNDRWEYVNQDELVRIIRKHFPGKVKYFRRKDKDGKRVSIPYYAFESRFKDCRVPVKVAVVLNKLFEDDDKSVRILFSTSLKQGGEEIIELYRLRWGIERVFAELKELFYFDQYQTPKLKTAERYWFLAVLAWTLAYWLKQTGALCKVVAAKQERLADTVRAVRALLEHRKNLGLAEMDSKKAYGIRSKRALKRAVA